MDAWNKLGGDAIEKSFKASALKLNVDESKGSRIHCFKQDQRGVHCEKYRKVSKRFARNYAETVPFRKIFTPGNQMKLRYFSHCSWL